MNWINKEINALKKKLTQESSERKAAQERWADERVWRQRQLWLPSVNSVSQMSLGHSVGFLRTHATFLARFRTRFTRPRSDGGEPISVRNE